MNEVKPTTGTNGADLPFTAYRLVHGAEMPLVTAPLSREWMANTREGFAHRCLPLLIANQSGWLLLNTHPLLVIWYGGDDANSVRLEFRGGSTQRVVSHFGRGILTWKIPYVFRTPPGYNLLVRGPANWPKDGASPLEGMVETDWSVATFTMNWQLTRPRYPVIFEAGEPICMVVPQRRGELESFRPEIRDMQAETALNTEYWQWHNSRARFLAELPIEGSDADKRGWEKDYFRGRTIGGNQAHTHQLKLKLRDFAHTSETNETNSSDL